MPRTSCTAEPNQRQARTADAARRTRLVGRIEAALDAPDRWELLLAALERRFDLDRDLVDHALGSVVEIPPERVALLAQLRGGHR
jgi:hypothetical protein